MSAPTPSEIDLFLDIAAGGAAIGYDEDTGCLTVLGHDGRWTTVRVNLGDLELVEDHVAGPGKMVEEAD